MKREILFRGKRLDNGEWVYGYLYITHTGEYEIGSYNKELDIERWTAIVDPATVGQYTGLADKNGKKIFERDIVKTLERDEYGEQRCFPVVCVKGAFWLYDKFLIGNDGLDFLAAYDERAIEIIGNIHDSPELLEEVKG